MPISKPHSSLGSTNTGSCSRLANYLEKENEELSKMVRGSNSIKDIALYEKRKQSFFTHSSDSESVFTVIDTIDNNKKNLEKRIPSFMHLPSVSVRMN